MALIKTKNIKCPFCGGHSARIRRVSSSTTNYKQRRIFTCQACKSARKV